MEEEAQFIIRELEKKLDVLQKRSSGLAEQSRSAQRLMEYAYMELDELQNPDFDKGPFPFDGITFIIAYYNIPRQIERTLISCSPVYQKSGPNKIEVIIADNGSTQPLPADIKEKYPFVSKIIRTEGKPSPVFALNSAIKEAKFNTIGLIIDGAHILSPGVFRNTRDICRMFARPVINIPQYSLGNISQNLNPKIEDAFDREAWRLNHLGWPEQGYNLFHYAVFSSEMTTRSIFNSVESNCLISKRSVFDSHGAFDERFDEPGAGFANLEMFSRLINHPENKYVVFPGEGTFHQDHDGTTTKKSPEERDRLVEIFKKKYTEITGLETLVNISPPMLYGVFRKSCQNVPTISKEYGKAKDIINEALANIYVQRTKAGIFADGYRPNLVDGFATEEIKARPPLKPRGLDKEISQKTSIDLEKLKHSQFLQEIHKISKPKLYFEIGVNNGSSLSLSKCRSIAVDPNFTVTWPITNNTRLIRETSDTFFGKEKRLSHLFNTPIDLAFLNGNHLAEQTIRDFLNTEKYCVANSLIMINNVYAEQMEMIERYPRFNAWCGDTYKIIPILKRYRPRLEIGVFETFIGPYRTGISIIKNIDPKNTVLFDNYEVIEKEIKSNRWRIETIDDLDDMVEILPYSDLENFLNA